MKTLLDEIHSLTFHYGVAARRTLAQELQAFQWGDESVTVAEFLGSVTDELQRATLIDVEPEMGEVLYVAATSFPDTPLRLSEVPWRSGYVRLPRPWRAPARVEKTFNPEAHAFQWVAEGDYVMLFWWGRSSTGSVQPIWITRWQEGLRPSEFADDPTGHQLVGTFWALIQQRVAVEQRVHTQPRDRRRWARSSTSPLPLVLRLVLRRPASAPSSAHRETNWSHRWLVGGHWRQQWYARLREHRPVWIAPYVKGPEDKALVLKDRVYAWKR